MLDLVSNGRADFGSGESSSEAELGGFRINPLEKRAMWEEGLRVALRCMTETPFTGHPGDYVTMPPRNVVPKPVQKPHPPVWVACTPARDDPPRRRSTASVRWRSRSSTPRKRCTGSTTTTRRLASRLRADRRHREPEPGVRHHVHVPRRTKTKRCDAGSKAPTSSAIRSRTTTCSASIDRARPTCGRSTRQHRAQRGYTPEAVEATSEAGDRLGAQIVQQEGFFGLRGAVGTPDQIREYLERYEEAGVDQVIFCSQSGKNRHEDIMESLELFGKEVLPAFLDRDEKLQHDKARRLEPVIEAAMARKPASDHPPLGDPAYQRSRPCRARRTAEPSATSSPSAEDAANHRPNQESVTRPPVP